VKQAMQVMLFASAVLQRLLPLLLLLLRHPSLQRSQ
jgi:hypothetical protein